MYTVQKSKAQEQIWAVAFLRCSSKSVNVKKWDFFIVLFFIQRCFFCRPSNSAVSEDAGIEPSSVPDLMFLGLPDPLVRGPDSWSGSFYNQAYSKKNIDFLLFSDFIMTFHLWRKM
jgi:hypothetical protein